MEQGVCVGGEQVGGWRNRSIADEVGTGGWRQPGRTEGGDLGGIDNPNYRPFVLARLVV